ncbi:MAG: type ISP restriction/modification enzyme [Thermus sp.]|uniref:type ISP restriction/modification enzyme n=1 Tax=Thermus sp. TaxID=275 RepID=UPI003D0FFBDB
MPNWSKYLTEFKKVSSGPIGGGGSPEAQLVPLITRLLKDLTSRVRVVQEFRTGLGRPDMAVYYRELLVGFVELKAPGKGADPERFTDPHDKRQWENFRHLPNLVYTDGESFALYREGSLVRREVLRNPKDGARVEKLFWDFLHWKPLVPKDPKELARFLAPLTRFLREAVVEALREDPEGRLAQLYREWAGDPASGRPGRFLPGASEEAFADAYAQLMAYGFLLARMAHRGKEPLSLELALELLEGRHGLLMEALFSSNHPQALKPIDPAYKLLRRAIAAVNPARFRRGGADPWLYFYEDFLEAYDPQLRKDMGVYYTPVPVVQAMVRLVDDLLRTKMGKPLGLAEEGVTVMDPAVGTGTFLLAVLDRALANAEARYGPGVRRQYATKLADRLYALEVMVGPYAVAQLRLSRAIEAEGGRLPPGGLHVYLADTLEVPDAPLLVREFFYERLAQERREAARVKREVPILVILGNPPYDRVEGESEEARKARGKWIVQGREDPNNNPPPPLEDFLAPLRALGQGVHAKNLYNLYVYFWRFALWKAFEQDPKRPGVVAFITASSYLTGPGFAGMRAFMRQLAHEIYVLDLGGEGRGAVRDENVFNIQTPVAIALVVRYGEKAEGDGLGRVFYHRLGGATREQKFAALGSVRGLGSLPFVEVGSPDPHAPFVPGPTGEYATWPRITRLFPWQHSGVEFKRTWPIGPTRGALEARWKALLSAPPSDRPSLFREDPGREVRREYPPVLARKNLPPIASLGPGDKPEKILRYGYRSFDRAWAIVDGRVCSRPRPPLWRTWGPKQLYLTSLLTSPLGRGPALTATALVPDRHHFSGRGGKDVIPLYRDKKGRKPNLTRGLQELLEGVYGFPVSPEDFAAYVYALLAQPAFTKRFQEEVRYPPVRVPLTKDPELFKRGVALGSELLWLHTYGERYAHVGSWDTFQGKAFWGKAPSAYPQSHRYDPGTRTLHVGDGEVKEVAPEVWGYEVSGFRPLKAWLDYRKKNRGGKKSSPLDGIVPSHWDADLSRELLELIWVLERTLDLHPRQEELLEDVLRGPLFTEEELPTPAPGEEEAPVEEPGEPDPQQEELLEEVLSTP